MIDLLQETLREQAKDIALMRLELAMREKRYAETERMIEWVGAGGLQPYLRPKAELIDIAREFERVRDEALS